ncbi:MAG: nuclear transport factor 2 family protein [Cyanobacterium sp. T60_A2020_053]|nr:nuclear transport factor 2 family protein [Cyanobacterium sp. T60_A2020_053]
MKKQNKSLTINIFLILFTFVSSISSAVAQDAQTLTPQQEDIYLLIEQYNRARENKDVTELEKILTSDIDQLASSGEWRRGIESSINGMLRSSNQNQGKRTITIEKVRLLDASVAIVDARYQIELNNNTIRNLWSTFIVVRQNNEWQISAIRNMSPTQNP